MLVTKNKAKKIQESKRGTGGERVEIRWRGEERVMGANMIKTHYIRAWIFHNFHNIIKLVYHLGYAN